MHFSHHKAGKTLLRIVLKQQAFNKRYVLQHRFSSVNDFVFWQCLIMVNVKRLWRVREVILHKGYILIQLAQVIFRYGTQFSHGRWMDAFVEDKNLCNWEKSTSEEMLAGVEVGGGSVLVTAMEYHPIYGRRKYLIWKPESDCMMTRKSLERTF